MKNQRVIHVNSFGYVSRCNCCDDLQLCLGNFVLTLGQNDFQSFKRHFFEFNDMEEASLHRGGSLKRYTFFTSYSNLTLSLSELEFRLTTDLLNMAQLDYEINSKLNNSI